MLPYLNLGQQPLQARVLLCQHPLPVRCLSTLPLQGLAGCLILSLQGQRGQAASLQAHTAWLPSAVAIRRATLSHNVPQLHT